MISEAEAVQRVLSLTARGPVQRVPLFAAAGCFASGDVLATVANPAFDNSSMDGYAVIAADSQAAQPLRITGEQPAGLDRKLVVKPREAVRIFTGAPMPAGADAVIMQEDVELRGDAIICRGPVAAGENMRRTAADLCRGQRIISAGDHLTPARIGLLASQGLESIEVARLPRVAILTTGDELAPAGAALQPGQIYNSNGPMLHALLAHLGITEITRAHCGDELEETTEALAQLADAHDFMIIAGGVSVGDRDQIKPALIELGLAPELWRVRLRPGKPFLFAHREQPRPLHVFGLPGNPVSAFVTFHAFVRPALLRWLGASDDELAAPSALAEMAAPLANDGDRPHYLRGRLIAGKFNPLPMQQSHALNGLSQANALLRLEAGETIVAGSFRPVLLL